MALDSAIQNVGEYYAAHYLAEQFPKDIAEQIKSWKAQGSQSVPRKLQGLSDYYFRAKAQALEYPEPEIRTKGGGDELVGWHSQLLAALGYVAEPLELELETEQHFIPALLRLHRHNRPWLAVLEAPFCLSDGEQNEEPLELPLLPGKVQQAENLSILDSNWEKAVAILFKQEESPRWALLLAGSRIYLFDAHTYAQGRYLYINLDDAFARKQAKTFEAIAALVSNETLAPGGESDEVLHEKLREGSLKSTHGVSSKLQAAVRQAIQLIANGWVEARRAKNLGYRQLGEREEPLPDGSREVTAEQLRHEALVTVYRILFCLYAEARGGELGVLPIIDDVYRLGYSIEALRDLADRGEPGTSAENGSYYAEHLKRLFQLIHEGFHPEVASAEPEKTITDQWRDDQDPYSGKDLLGEVDPNLHRAEALKHRTQSQELQKAFNIEPLTATLFAPDATPLLNRVNLTNRVLHQVVRCLSLGTGEKGKQIGRINYAELGIVQLGSVYEGLLAYKGFFATEDLIQVLQAPKKQKSVQPVVYDDAIDPATPTWFVPKDRLEEFKTGEVIIERRTKQARIYKTGEFILHLNGVDRINSASYYTPVPLTEALVRETLKERLKGFGPEQADEILKLKVCEPAMGSAAFLVEAIGQLANCYLDLKQKQTGQNIDPGDYGDQRRRTMHYIAVHNLYGVDLNPTAVELGALSLWLASIHQLKIQGNGQDMENGGQPESYRSGGTPWFGLRLRAGNSLIGARRAVWSEQQLTNGDFFGKDAQAPRQLKPGELRKQGEIYHFLVWDEDMASVARDKLIKSFWPEQCKTIAEWQKDQVKKKWTLEQLASARRVCDCTDKLWEEYAKERVVGLDKTRCTASTWPNPIPEDNGPTLARQEAIKAKLESESGAFQRLHLLMDAWCSFYFWPLEEGASLPSRQAWLAAAEVLLGIEVADQATRHMLDIQLGEAIDLDGLFQAVQSDLPDTQQLASTVPWYGIARDTASRQPFHHWELIFAEILGPSFEGQVEPPQGFDLMFGNPPWIKVSWNDATLLAEFEPKLGVRDAKSATYNRERPKLLEQADRKYSYRDAFEKGEGAGVFLNDRTLYPALAGMQTNLYKNFIERSWGLLASRGVAGLLHEEGVFDDSKGGRFRAEYFQRLVGHYHFRNELNLFADVGHQKTFSINVYKGCSKEGSFKAIFNLFSPATIERCQDALSSGVEPPGIKNSEGRWDTRGHPHRLLNIGEKELSLFAKLLEDVNTPPLQTRLPQVHSHALLKVLEKFAAAPKRLVDLKGQYLLTEMFHESNAQDNGIITREVDPTFQPQSPDEWVLSGPHFYVGNPLNRTPRSQSLGIKGSDFDDIDLTEISDDYFPRAIYRPGDRNGDLAHFYSAIPEWPRPSKPENGKGCFWPVSDAEIAAWEALLGEPLKRYGIDPNNPGAKTARQFGYFVEWQGDVEGAMQWLQAKECKRNSDAFAGKFGGVRLRQAVPDEEAMLWLPKPLSSYHRYVTRRRGQPANERTLIPSLMPAGSSHINTVLSIAFNRYQDALIFLGCSQSILLDFLVKIGGRSDIYESTLLTFPLAITNREAIARRVLRLSCLTVSYKLVWESCVEKTIRSDAWVSIDPRLTCEHELPWSELTSYWQHGCALRSDFARRQALLEMDVLVALALGLAVEELVQIYNVQFPVMKSYEEVDLYDVKGHRLPSTTRKDAGAKELREALKNHDDTSPVTVSWCVDNGNQTVTKTFYPPFTPVDRIEDYRRAYEVFQQRLETGEP